MTHQSSSDSLHKASLSNPHLLGNCLLLDHPLLGISVALRAGGGWGMVYRYFVELHNAKISFVPFCFLTL